MWYRVIVRVFITCPGLQVRLQLEGTNGTDFIIIVIIIIVIINPTTTI